MYFLNVGHLPHFSAPFFLIRKYEGVSNDEKNDKLVSQADATNMKKREIYEGEKELLRRHTRYL